MILVFNWENSVGYQSILTMVNNILNIIRWVVPIGLIIMTSIDVFKKVINPDEKEGMKKIIHRLIAALIVFLAPLIINLVLKLVNVGNGGSGSNGNTSSNRNGNIKSSSITSSDVSILYCPSSSLYLGSSGGLSSSIAKNYNGEYYWHVDKGSENITIYSQDNGKTIAYTINSYPSDGEIIVSLSVDQGKITKTCRINVLNIRITNY